MRPATLATLATVATVLAATGCYSPTPPSGGYTCDDTGCPSNLVCKCGTCVKGDDDAACSIGVTFTAPACTAPVAAGCVKEGDEFEVTLTAFKDAAYSQPSSYSGTAVIGSSWGHARAAKFRFSGGVATVKVTLDRATPANSSAVLTAQAGTTRGVSVATIAVDPQPLVAEPAAILKPGDSWAKLYVGLPSVDSDGKRLYYNGIAGLLDAVPRIGYATTTDGNTWTSASQPMFPAQPAKEFYVGPSVVRTGADKEVQLYFGSFINGAGDQLVRARSTDDGATFAAPTVVLPVADCHVCDASGLVLPWVLRSPVQGLLLYFTHVGQATPGSLVAVGRSVNNGDSWLISPVPAPGSGMAMSGFSIETAIAARVVYDNKSELYRMWYTASVDAINVCKNEIRYATSEDGLFWTGARDNGRVMSITDVPWGDGQSTGLVAGSIEIDDTPGSASHYRVWYSPVQSNLLFGGFCMPTGIGRANRK